MTGMAVCALCGAAHLGCRGSEFDSADHHNFGHMPPEGPDGTPPASFANALLADYMVRKDGDWYVCGSCLQLHIRNRRLPHLVYMTHQYVKEVLKQNNMHLQLLSLVDIRMNTTERLFGFLHGNLCPQSILDIPYICWDKDLLVCNNSEAVKTQLGSLLAMLMLTNPHVQAFHTMLERPHPEFGTAIFDADAVKSIVQDSIARGPLYNEDTDIAADMLQNELDVYLGTLDFLQFSAGEVELQPTGFMTIRAPHPLDNRLFKIEVPEIPEAPEPIPVRFSKVMGLARAHNITIEEALFPYLFPHGKGANRTGKWAEYGKLRASQSFSPHTLSPQYMLWLYQIKRATLIAGKVQSCVLNSQIEDYMKMNPGATLQQCFKYIARYKLESKKLAGSPEWHKERLDDLLEQVNQWGMPHFLLTLTSDEVSEFRFAEFDIMESILKEYNHKFTWANAPTECVRLLNARMKLFLKEKLNIPDGILGRIKHYVARYEVQGRGSLHAHILLWLEEEDVERVAAEIVAVVPADMKPEFEGMTAKQAGVSFKDLFQRPSDPLHQTLFDTVLRKQGHICVADGCMYNARSCRYGFPHDVQTQVDSHFDTEAGRWKCFRPRDCDRNIVDYHPAVALFWGGHHNLVRITDSSWSYYMMKYTMKTEPLGNLKLNAGIAKNMGLHDFSEQELQLISALVLARPVSPTLAALDLLQIPLVWCGKGDSVTHVKSVPPRLRSTRWSPAGPSRVLLPPVNTYELKPASLVQVTFYEYFRTYEILDAGAMSQALLKSESYCGVDGDGRVVLKRASPILVRYSDYHPTHAPEAFFYNLLLQKVPFATEASLLSPDNLTNSYLRECMTRGLITDTEDLLECLQEYSRRHMLEGQDFSAPLQKLTARYNKIRRQLGLPVDTGGVSDDDEPVSDQEDPDLPCQTYEPQPTDFAAEFSSIASLALTEEQQTLFDRILAAESGLYVISGPPGCGKSLLTKKLAVALEAQGRRTMLMASTGIAAVRLSESATTVHSSFAITAKRTMFSVMSATSASYQELLAANVFLIDEFSMLTSHTLNYLILRLKQVHNSHVEGDGDGHVMFGQGRGLEKVLLIFVGDHAQLPAVCWHAQMETSDICLQCRISTSPHWASAVLCELFQSVRHRSDPGLQTLLDEMRYKIPSAELLETTLKDCYCSEEDMLAQAVQDSVVLCSHNQVVDDVNTKLLAKFHAQGLLTSDIVDLPVHMAPKHEWARNFPEVQEWLAKPRFHSLPQVAEGAHVMLTSNGDLKKREANGATGVVVKIRARPGTGEVYSIMVKLDSVIGTGKTVSVTRTKSRQSSVGGKHIGKSTFPLRLAYAMTVHKSQGATLETLTFIYITVAFCCAMWYVALSRVPSRENLRIIIPPKPEDCRPAPPLVEP